MRTRPRTGPAQADPEVERAVVERVSERAHEWFPDAGPNGSPGLRLLSSRPRARLYAVSLGEDAGRPRILAKVRTDGPTVTPRKPGTGRPSLSAQPLPAADLAALEFAGLRAIADLVAGDPRFGAVRPLDHLEEHATILLDFVEATTLRTQLIRSSRLAPLSRPAPTLDGSTWARVGAWLAIFQRAVPARHLPMRQESRTQVAEMFEAYERFLTDRLGVGSVKGIGLRGAELATRSLPDSLPLAVGHGDYAPRNIFHEPDGRVTVFDPLARWAVPTYEDLGRFLVNVRLMGLQVHTYGAGHSAGWVESLERDVVGGYRQEGGDAPEAALRCYELLLLLDKWSALVGGVGGVRGGLRRSSMRLTAGYIRGQATRLLELAGA